MTFQEAGRRGGLATAERMGREYMKELGRRGGLIGGKLGGRPRLITLEEARAAYELKRSRVGHKRSGFIY